MPDPKWLKVPHPCERSQKLPGCQPDRHRAKSSAPSVASGLGMKLLPCRTSCRVSGVGFLAAVTCLPLKERSSRVRMGCLTENRKKKKSMCYWEMHFQIHHSATPSLRLILSPRPGTCHRESQRTGFPADIKILPFSWQIRENLFSEADTSSLVYRSLICWWVCHRAFTKLHPCFS